MIKQCAFTCQPQNNKRAQLTCGLISYRIQQFLSNMKAQTETPIPPLNSQPIPSIFGKIKTISTSSSSNFQVQFQEHSYNSTETRGKIAKLRRHTAALWAHDGDDSVGEAAIGQLDLLQKPLQPLHVELSISVDQLRRDASLAVHLSLRQIPS